MDVEAGVIGGLQQREAAEGDRRVRALDQIQPGDQEGRAVGAHVAVEEQQGLASRGGGQAVAADGSTLVGLQRDQADRQGHRLRLGLERPRQRLVAGAVVELDQLHAFGQGSGLAFEHREERAGIVAQEGNQDGQRRAGGGPGGVVANLGGGAHAGTFPARARSTSLSATSRTWAAFRIRATPP